MVRNPTTLRRLARRIRLRSALLSILALFAAWLAPERARAQTEVDLQLVLAVDVSRSVSDLRYELQKRGYADAFRHPRVLKAIRSGHTQSIAVTLFQWTGYDLQVHSVPWMLVKDAGSIEALAAAIDAMPRSLYRGGTSISGAIDYGVGVMGKSPYKGMRRIIDVSGDGSNNRGRPVTLARDDAVAAGIVINGLPILALEPYLDKYFWDNVIGGPGSFVVAAQTYETFAEAVLKKLVTEIAMLR